MTSLPWWQTGVIYQVYPRSFSDSNGDGVGDLRGLTQRLDYLSRVLGVDAIWISPFFPSPMVDFGYDVADFCDVDPLFGNLRDFDELIAEAHARGLRVVIDFVANHTSDQHPWFVESRASRGNHRRNWYVWKDPADDGEPPNNWLAIFGGSAWTLDPATRQYYLHTFLPSQPDLNWRNPDVEHAMMDVLRFWLERGVDGFRIDAAHYVMKDPLWRDNPLRGSTGEGSHPVGHKALGEYDTQVHVHDGGHEDVHEVFRKIRKIVDTHPEPGDRVAIGEIHMFDLNRWASFYGQASGAAAVPDGVGAVGGGSAPLDASRLDELHMPFNFSLLKAPWTAEGIRQAVDELERVLPPGAWPNYVLGNHDEPRIASRYGEAASGLVAMLLLTLRGTPTLYYGDELAIPQTPIPDERQKDPYGRRVPGMGRDGCRTPMAWSAGAQGGFTTSREPWLPLHDDYEERNVEVQLADPGSRLNLVRRLLELRGSTPALQVGTYTAIDRAPPHCFVYLRTLAEERRLVALNFGPEDRTVSLPAVGRVLLSTYMDSHATVETERVTVRGGEGVLVALQPR